MTRRKRAHGEGALYWSEARKTWVAEILLPNGKKKRKRNKQQRVVRTWLESQKEAVRKGVWVSDESVRYGDFLDRYIKDVAAHTLRPKTQQNYAYDIKNHIKPALGDKRIVAIRPEHLHSLYSDMLKAGLSKHTVKHTHAIISMTLGTALKWGLVARNVAESATPPTPENREIKPLTVEEVKRLLNVLESDKLYAFYLLLATTAIRKSEALALQKENLRLDDGMILIKHSLSQVYGKGLILGEPKSAKSRRELALPPITIAALRKHLADYPSESTYVFTTKNGTPISPINIIKHFKRRLLAAGLPEETRIHDIHHSVISWWLKAGLNIREVQELAGHAQASTTLAIYSHVVPGYNQEAAEKIEGMFGQE